MSEAQWMDIDVTTLSDTAQVAYAEYKAAQKQAAILRKAFEVETIAGLDIPAGKVMVFGYKFGKLSAAIVVDDRKPSKSKQAKGSLADFLAAQGAGGHAS